MTNAFFPTSAGVSRGRCLDVRSLKIDVFRFGVYFRLGH